MRKAIQLLILLSVYNRAHSQEKDLRIVIMNEKNAVLPASTYYLLNRDSVLIRTGSAGDNGIAEIKGLPSEQFLVKAESVGYAEGFSRWLDLSKQNSATDTIFLRTGPGMMKELTVISKRPFVQVMADKTVINPEANISNAGATVMEVLEKSPGITVGKDGAIIMKGKPAVMVFVDGKPTQLSGAELQAYLSGMNASQVDVIELIDNPGARYDASGNAGIINIKTRTIRQRGFNGSLNLSAGQGVYTKTANSLNLNFRNGKTNWFLNYGMGASTEFQDIWTLRTYLNAQKEDSALLEQPNNGRSRNVRQNVKTGLDYFVNDRTTLSLVFTGNFLTRSGRNHSDIVWMSPGRIVDSIISTGGETSFDLKRGGVNLSGRHKVNKHSEFTFDVDYVKFSISNEQHYQTKLLEPGSPVLATQGNTPSNLDILTLKVDYSKRTDDLLLEAGLKTAINKTDNLAEYFYLDNSSWIPDLARTNHFIYNEKISAAYISADREKGKWHWQAGLRYEFTSYKANQLGNAVVKDSSFNKNYGSLFPTAFVSFQANDDHVITFRTGRRIDRPPFQFLNPFLRTLNKYTYEGGNPFIMPQYTWNFSLSHTYKQKLTTEFSFAYLDDYFSQIFIIDSASSNVNKNIIIYTRGNVGSFQNFGISETYQAALTKWWNLTAAAVFNHKIIRGMVWAPMTVSINQLNISLNNQFQFKKGWAAEISGYYQTRSQVDLQEWLEPQGELNFGISKQVLKGKGSLKLNVRDVTYFQNYSGFSTFENSREPFTIQWDSRVVRLSFNWRFGKPMKTIKRSEGGATEEINRVGG